MEKKIRIVGMMDNKVDNTLESANRVYDKAYCCPTVNTCQGGGRQPKVIRKIKVVAMRGREVGQQLEPRNDGTSNTITTVTKDNLVIGKAVRWKKESKIISTNQKTENNLESSSSLQESVED